MSDAKLTNVFGSKVQRTKGSLARGTQGMAHLWRAFFGQLVLTPQSFAGGPKVRWPEVC